VLVLARKIDESIVIGENIVVKVVGVENGVVKLGIDAPKEIAIMRSELLEEIAKRNKEAMGNSDAEDISALSKLLGNA